MVGPPGKDGKPGQFGMPGPAGLQGPRGMEGSTGPQVKLTLSLYSVLPSVLLSPFLVDL